ncbi:MAG: DNA translocase FtsK, partial [Phycisphaerales bacterium]|nr:DNA translocase FtsK [Phycisphaerales bacterium]
FQLLSRGRVVRVWQRAIGALLLVGCTSSAAHLLITPDAHSPVFGHGGLIGVGVGEFLRRSFAALGTTLVLTYAILVALVFLAEGWVTRGAGMLRDSIVGIRRGKALPAVATVGVSPLTSGVVRRPGVGELPARDVPIKIGPAMPKRPQMDLLEVEGVAERPATGDRDRAEKASQRQRRLERKRRRAERRARDAAAPPSGTIQSEMPPAVEVTRAASVKTAEPALVLREDPSKTAVPAKRPAAWKLPPLKLLDAPEFKFTAAHESVLREKARLLERTLQEFRLSVRVVEIDTGPVITMFELELSAGVKVSQVAALANDIARAMKAPAVRIVAPIPGKNTIGVEVPNLNKEKVRLKGLILGAGDKIDKMAVPLLLGKDASGAVLVQDLTEMPHLLIAGTTGSGKSVGINAIIMSILMCRRPDMVKLVLIDPKMVELSHFKDVPHLMSPIITETQRAERVLDWAVGKMEERYALLAEARVRNIASYNELGREELDKRFEPASDAERTYIPTYLPYIVLIIDELADLMMTTGKEVEHHLSRLAQKSRAVGIHIIVATQRPEARVVTGLIKSNLPCRCAFRVASRMDSRIVMDQNGAETLMGQGDMLFLPPGSHKPVRAQGAFIEEHELHGVLEFLKSQGSPDYHPELVKAGGTAAGSSGERDPLFDEAAKVVLASQRGSVSLLQRRLMVGYSRAARLIDQMAECGIVGDYKGSQAREVIMTLEQWKALRQEAQDEAAMEERRTKATASADSDGDEPMGRGITAVGRAVDDRKSKAKPAGPGRVVAAEDDDEEWEDDDDDDLDDDDELDDDDDDEDDLDDEDE